MHLSAMLTSLPLEFAAALDECRALGFTHVDIVARVERPAGDLDALADSGLLVSCTSIGRDLPEGCTLDATAAPARQQAVDTCRRQLDDAARLGATHAYIVPGLERAPEALANFASAVDQLVAHAGSRHVQLCLEHIPARALREAGQTLDWLQDHPGLKLLLDIGHFLITKEDPAAFIARAGNRLGYVHLDDNDGVGDLHWPLLTGKLTRDVLAAALRALPAARYDGALAFELNPGNEQPVAALRAGKALIEDLLC